MDAITNATINMMVDIEELYDQNQADFDTIPAFAPQMVLFKAHNASIALTLPLAEETTVPTTRDKDLVLENMCVAAATVCKPVQAYAASINDLVLEGSMNWTASSLEDLVKDIVGPTCVSLHTMAVAVKVPAADFGLKQSELDDLAAKNTAWAAKQSATRTKQVASSQAKKQVLKLVADNKKMLVKLLDRMVSTLTATKPELVGLWNQTRHVIDPATTTTTQRITVEQRLPDDSLLPLYEATVLMTIMGNTLTKQTNSLGEVEYKPIKKGIYRVTVSKPGFHAATILEYRVVQGKINKLVVELVAMD